MPEDYYVYKGKKIFLKKSNTQRAFRAEGEFESPTPFESMPGSPRKDRDDGIVLVKKGLEGDFESLGFEELNVYEKENLETAILTYEFIVKFKKETTEAEINRILNNPKFGFKKLKFGELRYLVWIHNKEDYKNILETIRIIRNENSVEYVQPKFKRIQNLQQIPDVIELQNQWALNKPDVNINVKPVWDRGIRGKGVTVAIVDSGVDVSHEDFARDGHNVSGYDAINDIDEPSPVGGDSHGTRCTGIIAATGNNAEGISGVAPECQILAIRVAKENKDGTWNTDDEVLTSGILAAVELNADVISNSWYYGHESEDIEYALEVARMDGRNGDGCVVIFASGNYHKDGGNGDMSISYPGNLSHLVITVGAYNDEGKWVGESRDESWASRFGPALKLCAPGLKIRTTDVTGAGGIEGDYATFSGTSAAAPHIAGVAALILSANKNLKATEVEKILLESCDPMNSNPSTKTGNGKVNGEKAVNKALGI